MSSPVTVGGWIEAYCTSCRRLGEHIVVALVGVKPAKVECTSCHGQHRYRATLPDAVKASTPRASRRASPSSESEASAGRDPAELNALIGGRTPAPYDIQRCYLVGDVVGHPQFGTGVVLATAGTQKVEILFAKGPKILLHDRGSVRPGLARPAPRRADDSQRVTDAPPRK